ncbi:BppU family phage baseplate upper protein [Clostridium perfringens]
MKEIYINADDYNSDSIKTIQGNNNAEEYKIYLQYDNEKIDLTGKTVNLGFLRVGSTEGDIIENLNVTNPKEGEITLKITNKISKRNGTYSCQLAILGEGDFLEHTATFTLTVENNIFSDITKAIADSKDFTYLENILDKASKLSEKLKENTSTATNANSNLESNINLAKEVKETIKDLDTKNIEATSKIERLEGLNAKAEELSNNINEALPVKDALVKNTEEAKAANTNLLAANQEATIKNTELQASLEKTKKYIAGLDGSQNIPQIRLDVDALQNGLKSNQALAYQGSSISANDTLEGRTEGMVIRGKTSVIDGKLESFGEKEKVGDKYKISILSCGKNLFDEIESEEGLLNVNTGELYKVNTSCTSGYIKVEKGKSYIISGEGEIRGYYACLYDLNKKYIEQKTFSKNIPFTFNQDGYFRFSYASEKEETPAKNILFEEGTQSSSYEAYKCDKKEILMKKPLCEDNYIYEDNRQVKVYKPTEQYIFTGNEEIIKDNAGYFALLGTGHKPLSKTINNKYPDKNTINLNENGLWCGNSYKFCIKDLSVSTVEEFKAKLKKWREEGKPLTVVYELATPVIEVVENCVDIDLDTFGEKTYFNIENSIKGSLDFKVPSNIASIVQSTAREVNNIWDVINNLLVPSLIDINKNVAMSTIKNNLK